MPAHSSAVPCLARRAPDAESDPALSPPFKQGHFQHSSGGTSTQAEAQLNAWMASHPSYGNVILE